MSFRGQAWLLNRLSVVARHSRAWAGSAKRLIRIAVDRRARVSEVASARLTWVLDQPRPRSSVLQIIRPAVLFPDRSIVDVGKDSDFGISGLGWHRPSLAVVFRLEAISSLSSWRWSLWIVG